MTTLSPATTTDRRKLTVIRADRLFDGTDVIEGGAVVVVDRHTIVAADRASQFTATDHADVVELPGATLLPGLVDTHVHLCLDASVDSVGHLAGLDDTALLAAMTAAARANLRAGVTTVRDLGDRGYVSLRLRRARDADLPTILAAGPPITSPGGHCHFLGGEASGIDGLRAAVRAHAERDVDVIKIMASGGHLTPGSQTDVPQFTRAELRAVVEEAHRFGLPVTAHAHSVQAITDALAVGVDGLEHLTFQQDGRVVDAPQDVLCTLVESQVAVGLTLGIVPVPDLPIPPFFAENLPRMMANVRRVVAVGACTVLGTDAGIAPVKPHGVLPLAVRQFAENGVTPRQALGAATRVAADVIGLGHRKGRLATGYDADVLAVDDDPLDDLTALQRVRAVYARGARVST
ncbi:MAG: amidohydrolase family protein [Actinophytocola sp.]|nr:amidohydrolase family protein [Actinophytocola sp.]